MKKLMVILFAFLPVFVKSQTVQLEKDYMNKLLIERLQTGTVVSELNTKFMAFIAENPYPELPYNKQLKLLAVFYKFLYFCHFA